MTRRLLAAAAFVLVTATAAPAFAQGYIGAYLVGDIARFDLYDSAGLTDVGNGEVIGFALRVGSELGSRWGVELEFVRPSQIESELTPGILPLAAETTIAAPGVVGMPIDPTIPFPIYSYSYRSWQRHTTLATSAWIRQEFSPRFSLAYLGGVSFGRTSSEVEITYQPIRALLFPVPPLQPSISESTTYHVGPVVGVEGRVTLAGQVQLVPGIRLHGLEGGWLIRPSLGLAWRF